MSLFFWRKNKTGHIEPITEWPKTIEAELPISCIAQHIIDDLDVKNIDKWKLENTAYSYYLDNGKYQIGISKIGKYGGGSYLSAYLISLSYKFNDREQKLLNSASESLYNLLFSNINKEYELKNQEKLKELFPDCFKNEQ